MKKRFLLTTLAIVMIMMLIPTMVLTVAADNEINPGTWGEHKDEYTEDTYTYADFSPFNSSLGRGSQDSPYEIKTPAQLAGLAALVNAYNGSPVVLTDAEGNTANATNFFVNGESQHVKLTADIDLSAYGWVPIGTGSTNAFKGSFDGDGHTVTNMFIGSEDNPSGYQYAGLFGYVTNGTIKNVGVSGEVNVNLTSGVTYVGGLVGYADATTIENCYNTCAVSGKCVTSNTGGIVGYASGTMITNSYNTGIVSGTGTTLSNAGGLVGYSRNVDATSCYWLSGSADTAGNELTGDSVFELSEAQMKAAEGATDSSWETIVILNNNGSLVDALNKWVESNTSYSVWHIHEGSYPALGVIGGVTSPNVDGQTHTVSCTGCNYLRTDEHSGGTATCTTQAVCETCGESYGDLDPDNHENNTYGYCELCQVKITGASITAGVDLTMKYYVNLIDTTLVGEAQKLAMIFTMNEKTVTVYANEAFVNGEYVFEFDGIAPQCMADLIDATLVVVDENGETVKTLADKKGYSVKANAEELLALYPEDAELKQFIVDMLTYGAAAQNYRDYNTENLANKDLSSEVAPSEALPTESIKNVTASESETVYFTSATVWFDNVNKIGVKLSVTENVKLVVKIGDDTVGTTYEDLTSTTFYTDAIYSTGFDTVYTFELYEGDTLVQTLTYSVSSYVFAMMNQVDTETGNPTEMAELAKALYRYGVSAKAYRNAKSTTVVTNAEELSAALNAGGNVQLGGNIELGDAYVSMTGDVATVLDLNGYTITSNSEYQTIEIFREEASLTVIDSSDSQNGAIVNNNESGTGIWNGGIFTVESGEIKSKYWGVSNYGTVYLNGGTLSGDTLGIRNEGGTYVNGGGTLIGGVEDDYIPV